MAIVFASFEKWRLVDEIRRGVGSKIAKNVLHHSANSFAGTMPMTVTYVTGMPAVVLPSYIGIIINHYKDPH